MREADLIKWLATGRKRLGACDPLSKAFDEIRMLEQIVKELARREIRRSNVKKRSRP